MNRILQVNHCLLFLKRVYKQWRTLFWVIIVLIAAQLFFMAKGIQNLPFFLYNMYSKVHPTVDSTAVYLVKTKDGYFNHKKLSNREQEILMNSIAYYVNLQRDGDGTIETARQRFSRIGYGNADSYFIKQLGNDSISLAAFPPRWGKYFSSVSNDKYDSATVVKTYVYSKQPYQRSATDSIVFTIKLK